MIPDGRATIARITAQRFGCTDERLLKLVERLACSKLHMNAPEVELHDSENGPVVFFSGSLDGKSFRVILSGEAIKEFT